MGGGGVCVWLGGGGEFSISYTLRRFSKDMYERILLLS